MQPSRSVRGGLGGKLLKGGGCTGSLHQKHVGSPSADLSDKINTACECCFATKGYYCQRFTSYGLAGAEESIAAVTSLLLLGNG